MKSPRVARRLPVRRILLATLPPAAIIGYLAWKWSTVASAGRVLAAADPSWLLLGIGAIALTFVAGAASLQGTVARRLPRRQLLTTQLAGVSANALLPAGVGAGLLTHRFLRRCGISRPAAVTALALNTAAGGAIFLLVIAAFCLLAPDRLPVHRPAFGSVQVAALSAAALAATAAAACAFATSRGRTAMAGIRRQVADARRMLRTPRRAALLWGGAAAGPLLHTIAITAVLHAIGQPIPVLDVCIAYFAASAVAALVPSPGSMGSLDIVLALTLSRAGADPQTAVTAVLGYRLLATWLPMLPSAIALTHSTRADRCTGRRARLVPRWRGEHWPVPASTAALAPAIVGDRRSAPPAVATGSETSWPPAQCLPRAARGYVPRTPVPSVGV